MVNRISYVGLFLVIADLVLASVVYDTYVQFGGKKAGKKYDKKDSSGEENKTGKDSCSANEFEDAMRHALYPSTSDLCNDLVALTPEEENLEWREIEGSG